ncbi:MAG TPA: hypothetical protein PK897_04830, partial [Treponema sp.]|nr:hypothetical protein [Treponema sp.]
MSIRLMNEPGVPAMYPEDLGADPGRAGTGPAAAPDSTSMSSAAAPAAPYPRSATYPRPAS